jgi:hypothetical protein
MSGAMQLQRQQNLERFWRDIRLIGRPVPTGELDKVARILLADPKVKYKGRGRLTDDHRELY